jgi:methylenetetrahydrofolate dehydrogenase (NADP+)/methenyltetrahydrofolate cyclohydrolase
VLDGEVVAARVRAEVAQRVDALAARGITPGLGTLLVGDDGPSARYVAMKQQDCAAVGIASHHVHLPADATQADVVDVVTRFNDDPAVDAYIMQYPFPAHLDYESALLAVDPAKREFCDSSPTTGSRCRAGTWWSSAVVSPLVDRWPTC